VKRFRVDYLLPCYMTVTAGDAEEAGIMAPMDAEAVKVTYVGEDVEDFGLDEGSGPDGEYGNWLA